MVAVAVAVVVAGGGGGIDALKGGRVALTRKMAKSTSQAARKEGRNKGQH
jgi:hypothetical protein